MIFQSTSDTEVVLHLKDSAKEFLDTWNLRSLITRYSDHIGFPIRMRDESRDGEGEWQDVNKASALWTLPKSEIADKEYQSFYKYLSHDLDDALCWAHNKVEGSQSYTTLLYVPGTAPMDLMLQRDERSGLRLYVKRVFIMDAAQQLLPHYLRFVRGVVDSDDLPLNVSRELLQENELSGKIRSAVIRRSLDLDIQMSKRLFLKKRQRQEANIQHKFARFESAFALVMFKSRLAICHNDIGAGDHFLRFPTCWNIYLEEFSG